MRAPLLALALRRARARERGEVTLPTTIALERATNPFLRAATVDEFAERRQAKDVYKG
mgnify:CR=1 FL=1